MSQSPAKLELIASRHFTNWMAEQDVSLAFTTYQAGKLFLLGRSPDGNISGHERTFTRCMGLWSDGQTIWMTSQFQIWRLENVLRPEQATEQSDRLYVPRVGYTTGDIDAHDIAVDDGGNVVFVNTLFGCLATMSEKLNFKPLWRPPFISKLAAEDRCHLNGLAMRDGRPGYVTACSQSDVADGWRDHRLDGGVVVDVAANEVIAEGLSMPHSPRWYRDRLWLLDSGTGFFGSVDLSHGRFEPISFCPGYARGLTFVGDFAVIGVSKPRQEKTFTGLQLDENLTNRNAVARCGLQVIDLKSGDVVHWLRIEGAAAELYDVVTLPGILRPKALGFKTDDIRRNIWFENQGKMSSWSAGD